LVIFKESIKLSFVKSSLSMAVYNGKVALTHLYKANTINTITDIIIKEIHTTAKSSRLLFNIEAIIKTPHNMKIIAGIRQI
jgi:hypothetical protein